MNFHSSVGNLSLIANNCLRWACSFKGLPQDWGQADFSENLYNSLFNKDLSNETNFSWTHLAGHVSLNSPQLHRSSTTFTLFYRCATGILIKQVRSWRRMLSELIEFCGDLLVLSQGRLPTFLWPESNLRSAPSIHSHSPLFSVADPLHGDADSDPDPARHFHAGSRSGSCFSLRCSYYFDADPDPAYLFDADPDPQHCLCVSVSRITSNRWQADIGQKKAPVPLVYRPLPDIHIMGTDTIPLVRL